MPKMTTLPRVAAITATVLAVVATISSGIALADSTTVSVAETWQFIGLATWAAVFGFLAVRPDQPVLWFIALANKGALVLAGLILGADVEGAFDLVLWDGLLCVVLVTGTAAALSVRRHGRALAA
jgi:hypothetical protein